MRYIGEAIRRERNRSGLTSNDLAERVTVTPQYIRLVECGGAVPAMKTVLEICNQFPDADSAEWLWLLLQDTWGQPVAEVMRRWAQTAAGVQGEGE